MSIKNCYKLFAGLQLLILGLGCNVNLDNYDFGDVKPGSNIITEEVTLSHFKKIKGKDFSFSSVDIRHLASSGQALYLSDSGMNMWSWEIGKGDIADAWRRVTDFTGVSPANFKVPTNNRGIRRLSPIRDGVAVGIISNNSHENAVAVFHRFDTKATWSFRLDMESISGFQRFGDMVEVPTKNEERALYLLLSDRKPGSWDGMIKGHSWNFVHWFNLDKPKIGSLGYGWGNKSILKYSNAASYLLSTRLSKTDNMQAIAALPDGRVALASPEGIFTIGRDSVGVDSDPRLEQKSSVLSLDYDNKRQFQSFITKEQPTQVGALKMVGDYLLITFVYKDGLTDAERSVGGFRSAKFDPENPNVLTFKSNLELPRSQVTRIVTDGLEARLISRDVIYSFRAGEFFEELNGRAFDKAQISRGFEVLDDREPETLDTFLGGASGEIPPDGTKFYDAAPFDGAWYYATDQGLYRVDKFKEPRQFDKVTKKAI